MIPDPIRLLAPKDWCDRDGIQMTTCQSSSFGTMGRSCDSLTLIFLTGACNYLHWNRYNVYQVIDTTYAKHPYQCILQG